MPMVRGEHWRLGKVNEYQRDAIPDEISYNNTISRINRVWYNETC